MGTNQNWFRTTCVTTLKECIDNRPANSTFEDFVINIVIEDPTKWSSMSSSPGRVGVWSRSPVLYRGVPRIWIIHVWHFFWWGGWNCGNPWWSYTRKYWVWRYRVNCFVGNELFCFSHAIKYKYSHSYCVQQWRWSSTILWQVTWWRRFHYSLAYVYLPHVLFPLVYNYVQLKQLYSTQFPFGTISHNIQGGYGHTGKIQVYYWHCHTSFENTYRLGWALGWQIL